MKCPECHGRTMVIDSRPVRGVTMRRRECKKCGKRYTTLETYSETAYSANVDLSAVERAFDAYWRDCGA